MASAADAPCAIQYAAAIVPVLPDPPSQCTSTFSVRGAAASKSMYLYTWSRDGAPKSEIGIEYLLNPSAVAYCGSYRGGCLVSSRRETTILKPCLYRSCS